MTALSFWDGTFSCMQITHAMNHHSCWLFHLLQITVWMISLIRNVMFIFAESKLEHGLIWPHNMCSRSFCPSEKSLCSVNWLCFCAELIHSFIFLFVLGLFFCFLFFLGTSEPWDGFSCNAGYRFEVYLAYFIP